MQTKVIKLDSTNIDLNPTLTVRVNTETFPTGTSNYGQLSNLTTADYQVRGILTFATKKDLQMNEGGYLTQGDALFKYSPNSIFKNSSGDATSVTPAEGDIVIEGDTTISGTYSAWIIRKQLYTPNQNSNDVGYVFACSKRENITIS